MAQARYPIGTLRQRATLVFMVAFILFALWTHRPSLGAPSPSPHVITGSSHHPASLVDLSAARAPFVAWPLARLCAETDAAGSFVPGLVFLCDNNSGGPGNIRNYSMCAPEPSPVPDGCALGLRPRDERLEQARPGNSPGREEGRARENGPLTYGPRKS